jgi:hypothetical protein
MNPEFHEALGPFAFDVKFDDSGVHLQQGLHQESVPWNRITGAVLLPPKPEADLDEKETELARTFLGGPDAVARLRALKNNFQQSVVAYRNERNHLTKLEVPIPMDNPQFLAELQSRLGSRWLGQVKDEHAAEKKLHTAPGVFKSIFILVVLFGIVVAFLGLLFFGAIGPFLNLLSIERMLLSLQDGDYTGLAAQVAVYVALFIIAYGLHRIWRSRMETLRARFRGAIPRR